MELTSGELFYREKAQWDPSLSFLASELTKDADGLYQKERYATRIKDLRKMRQLSRVIASQRIAVGVSASMRMMKNSKEAMLREMELLTRKHSAAVNREMANMDTALMQWILQYFAVVRDELVDARMRLRADDKHYEILSRHARLKCDLLSFAYRLRVETKGVVNLMEVERDTSQYKRCCKAVQDSLGTSFQRNCPGYNQMSVVNVFKLEHAWLSTKLQEAAALADSAKVKGLFCHIPKECVFGVCSYGLHVQYLEGLPEQADVQAVFKASAERGRGSSALFSSPWFDNDASSSSSAASKGDYRLAKKLADSYTLEEPRFSRSSASAHMVKDMSLEDISSGTFIALCRVLISRLRIVDGVVDAEKVRESSMLGYDAIYCAPTEEYTLLNPTHVLPEFIMHVKLEEGKDSEDKKSDGEGENDDPAAQSPSKGDMEVARPNLSRVCRVPAALQVRAPSVPSDTRRPDMSQVAAQIGGDVISLLLTNEVEYMKRPPHEASEDAIWERYQAVKRERAQQGTASAGTNTGTSILRDEMSQRDAMILKQNLTLNIERSIESFGNKHALITKRYCDATKVLADGLASGGEDSLRQGGDEGVE